MYDAVRRSFGLAVAELSDLRAVAARKSNNGWFPMSGAPKDINIDVWINQIGRIADVVWSDGAWMAWNKLTNEMVALPGEPSDWRRAPLPPWVGDQVESFQ